MFFTIINYSDYAKYRYIDQFYNKIKNESEREKFLSNSLYIKLYKSGFNVFKNYPLFGVGNKNYRVETCDTKKNTVIKGYYCLTIHTKFILKCYQSMGLLEQ